MSRLDEFLVDLFDRYADLLKRRFSDDFQEVLSGNYCEENTIADSFTRSFRLMIICQWLSTQEKNMRRWLTLAGLPLRNLLKSSRKPR